MSRFLWRKDFHIIPGGIDLELFKPMPQAQAREQLNLHPDKPLVLFVGSPQNAVKRHYLAQATIDILKTSRDVELIVATGVLPDQIPVYMNAADVLLVTSKHEGSPNVVKEAMACNLPIVSVDVGDVKERLRNVTECTVINSSNPSDLAPSLEKTLLRKQRSNGREQALELSEANLVQRQIRVYEKAIGG
jgi:glycosyltransferase involved in cell wall biosynthesis